MFDLDARIEEDAKDVQPQITSKFLCTPGCPTGGIACFTRECTKGCKLSLGCA